MPRKTPKTKSPAQPAQTAKASAVELSEKQLEQVAGGLVIREKMESPIQ
jgi:hypothetical protein